jgi:hypothetical protein
LYNFGGAQKVVVFAVSLSLESAYDIAKHEDVAQFGELANTGCKSSVRRRCFPRFTCQVAAAAMSLSRTVMMNGVENNNPKTLWYPIEWLQAKFDSALPPALLAGYLFFSALMVIATSACGLAQFPVNSWTAGYFWELNWGINHLLFIPIGLFCCALVIREVRQQIVRISDARMAVDRDFNDLTLDAIRTDWDGIRPGRAWFGVIATIVMIVCWGEWWIGSVSPIYIAAQAPERIGWTNGAATVDSGISKAGNVTLSFLAFTAQGFVATFFCYTVLIVLAFAIWIYRYANAEERKIIPNLASTDRRRGFQIFEPLMLRLLCMALAFTLVLFTIRLQVIYDHSESSATTAVEFVLQDVATGFFTNMANVFAGQHNELFVISLVPVYSMSTASTAMIVIFILVTTFPTLILYFLAQYSHDSLMQCLARADCPPCRSRGLTNEECAARLEDMDFYPMRYPRPMELVAYIVFAAVCFVFYKFTVVLFGVFAMRLVYVVYKTLTEKVPAPGG